MDHQYYYNYNAIYYAQNMKMKIDTGTTVVVQIQTFLINHCFY